MRFAIFNARIMVEYVEKNNSNASTVLQIAVQNGTHVSELHRSINVVIGHRRTMVVSDDDVQDS